VNFRTRRRRGPEVNLTPMIDVLFIVLMFLLLTTTFKEFTFVRVTLPDASSAQRAARDEMVGIRLVVEEDGTVYLDDKPVTLDQVREALAAVKDKENAQVSLAADERLHHGRVVELMDLVRRAGIYRLAIETVSDSRPAAGGS
jgi:biopolymer transport protein ExbD